MPGDHRAASRRFPPRSARPACRRRVFQSDLLRNELRRRALPPRRKGLASTLERIRCAPGLHVNGFYGADDKRFVSTSCRAIRTSRSIRPSDLGALQERGRLRDDPPLAYGSDKSMSAGPRLRHARRSEKRCLSHTAVAGKWRWSAVTDPLKGRRRLAFVVLRDAQGLRGNMQKRKQA